MFSSASVGLPNFRFGSSVCASRGNEAKRQSDANKHLSNIIFVFIFFIIYHIWVSNIICKDSHFTVFLQTKRKKMCGSVATFLHELQTRLPVLVPDLPTVCQGEIKHEG